MLAIYNPDENNKKPHVVYVPTYKKRFIAMTSVAILLLLFLLVRPNTPTSTEVNGRAGESSRSPAYEIMQIPSKEAVLNVTSNAQKLDDKPVQRSFPKPKIENRVQPPLEVLSVSPENFNLWTIDDKYREALLYLQYQREQNSTISSKKSKYAEITSGKDS